MHQMLATIWLIFVLLIQHQHLSSGSCVNKYKSQKLKCEFHLRPIPAQGTWSSFLADTYCTVQYALCVAQINGLHNIVLCFTLYWLYTPAPNPTGENMNQELSLLLLVVHF